MTDVIENIKLARKYLLSTIEGLSVEQLNEIPAGFNNNIIWNIGHLIAAQQGLCYVRSGLPLGENDIYFQAYKPGTKPDQFVDANEIEKIKHLLISTLDQLNNDYVNKIFKNYTSFTTRYGVEITNISEAIDFILFHEGLHSGYIMAIKRILMNNIST
jgi:hypothetical protein